MSLAVREAVLTDVTGNGSLSLLTADTQIIPIDSRGVIGGTGLPNTRFTDSEYVFQTALDFDRDGLADLAIHDSSCSVSSAATSRTGSEASCHR